MMNLMFYFLYFLLALTAALAATLTPGGVPVLDTDGKALRRRQSYYILPHIPGGVGGGLTLAPRGDKKCPLYVGQEISEVNKGLPARFSKFMSNAPVIPESDGLNIRIKIKPTNCSREHFWRIAEPENITEPLYITTGYPALFEIIKSNGSSSYQIVLFRVGLTVNYVGIFVDGNGVRRLALTSTPFEVVFKRAPKKIKG